MYQKVLESYVDLTTHRMEQIRHQLEDAPAGRLLISRNGEYYSWYVSLDGGKVHYLPKKDERIAARLALKRLLEVQLHDLAAHLEACQRYLRYRKRTVNQTEKLLRNASPEFRRLLGLAARSRDTRTDEWLAAPYETLDLYPDQRILPTSKEGEYVRSKIEAMVAAQLFLLGLPYRYEQMTVVGGKRVAPDFTVLDVRSWEEIPVEVFGLMSSPEYYDSYIGKMRSYAEAGRIPGVNMLVFYELPDLPLDAAVVHAQLERFFLIDPPRKFRRPTGVS